MHTRGSRGGIVGIEDNKGHGVYEREKVKGKRVTAFIH